MAHLKGGKAIALKVQIQKPPQRIHVLKKPIPVFLALPLLFKHLFAKGIIQKAAVHQDRIHAGGKAASAHPILTKELYGLFEP